MPVYSFKCPKCTLKFEKSLKIDFKGDVSCPDCAANATKLPPQNVMGKVGDVTSLPKDLDLKVGGDSDKKWNEYEDRKSEKEKVRKETNSEWISRDLDGGYTPLTVGKDKEVASKEEAVSLRTQMWQKAKDPTIDKYIDS